MPEDHAPALLVAANWGSYYRLTIECGFLEHDAVLLAIGFSLHQAHQQVIEILGEPQGGLALRVGLAYAVYFHCVELAYPGGDSFVAGHAEVVIINAVTIHYAVIHVGLAGHQIALQRQLVGGFIQQAWFGWQAEGIFLVHASDLFIGPVKGLRGLAATYL